jgi:hypothetical protein
MPHMIGNRRTSAAALAIALASLLLAACGGSSSSSSSTATSSASTSGASTPSANRPPGSITGRFAAIRECLEKNGIVVPNRVTGKPPSTGGVAPRGAFPGGAPQAPKGMSHAQFEAIVKKCGDKFPRGAIGFGAHINSSAVKQALAKFAACMRANGVNVPAPNTSGSGPVFNTKGVDTNSPAFQAADSKCRSDLQGAFRASPGGATAPPPSPTG